MSLLQVASNNYTPSYFSWWIDRHTFGIFFIDLLLFLCLLVIVAVLFFPPDGIKYLMFGGLVIFGSILGFSWLYSVICDSYDLYKKEIINKKN